MLQHHIEACAKVTALSSVWQHSDWWKSSVCQLNLFLYFSQKLPNMKEILLIGFYQPNEELTRFLSNAQQEFKISIR